MQVQKFDIKTIDAQSPIYIIILDKFCDWYFTYLMIFFAKLFIQSLQSLLIKISLKKI